MHSRSRLAAAMILLAAGTATAQPSTDLGAYALFAETKLKAKAITLPSGGGLGVNAAGGKLAVSRSLDAPLSHVVADRVRLPRDPAATSVAGVFANRVSRGAGPAPVPFVPPVVPSLADACSFLAAAPPCDPGNPITVSGGAVAPGVYGTLRVARAETYPGNELGGSIRLQGSYAFCSIEVERAGRLYFTGPSTVVVHGDIRSGKKAFWGPENPGVDPGDLAVFVGGRRVKFGPESQTAIALCAPAASLVLLGSTHAGRYAAYKIKTRELTLDAAVVGWP